MLNRRSFGAATTALTAIGALFQSRKAAAAKPSWDVEIRGTDRRLERLPKLDIESQQDFLTGFRIWVNTDLHRAAQGRANAILKAKGIEPGSDPANDVVVKTISSDPVVGLHSRAWIGGHQLMWKSLYDEFHQNADLYLKELEAADKAGPGILELNPNLELPRYTTHEIHLEPGGYVGDPFAGYMYHYATNTHFTGKNYQDQMHITAASSVPVPKDGKIKRILDQGCSSGQMSVALKQRFPDAEVWGIDVGAPMLRYAHMRAIDLGVDVNFSQRLVEDSKFPDNHFDIVTSYIIHHEMTQEATRQTFKEVMRILRPGGVYYPVDIYTSQPVSKDAYTKYRAWMDSRWNCEPWRLDYAAMDFPKEISAAGFHVNQDGPPGWEGRRYNIVAVKPA
ncbi:MAG: class I SAM-dependent methyltransferase [Alphaproteobacteria bacterium]|nr:class I SAM-dependent methyltransferase [Alphaproteobacteria bacterium]